ncbi:hypothetical protein [Allokutzneria sp. NRRL B-24872]|uniref:hypothetical protein n=1 Tax=Allokutzneria sp. NRRL B-24872 TaxID=1137961 RepID=UPI001177E175|nr:hypothetical protein [Allokutzneria sp. NRRL B-24872]
MSQQDSQTPMKMMFTAGFVAALVGLGILLSNGPSVGAVLAVLAGAGLVAASIRLRNAALDQQLYRAVRPADPAAVTALWGGLVGLLGLGALFGWLFQTQGGVLTVALWPLVVAWYRKRRTAVQVDATGVNVGGVPLPWNEVAELVVSDPRTGQEIQVGARLHSRAPVQVLAQHRGFDVTRLTAMVAKHGPQDVRVVVTGAR